MTTFKYFLSVFFILIFLNLNSQNKYTISGTVSDVGSNESLIGVNIIFSEISTGTITNEYGFYSITLPEGEYKMTVSYLGFQEISRHIILDQNITLNFELLQEAENLEQVIITQNIESQNIRKPQMSTNTLSASTIKQIPVVLGESDVVKAITLLPGITNAGDGSSGFNVRGGAADQNLILLDEATIYNSSHLFGLFSVFNPDAIKDLKLYKGGIPARYGGRISSVLDIYQKEGNSNTFHMNGGIGAVASRLLAEGPIKKEKGSFLLGARSSYAHLFLPIFDIKNVAYFYDLNTKLSYKLNKRNNIYLSGYFGRDVFSIADSFENTYGNAVLNFRWNHLFSNKLFSNLSLIYSNYYYGLKLKFVEFDWNSGIKNFNIKYDFKHYLNDSFKLEYGLNSMYYAFNPGEIRPTSESSGINQFKLTDKYAFENALYIDSEHKLSENFAISYGLRLSLFYRLGQTSLNIYENNEAVNFNQVLKIYEKAEPIDTKSYKRGDVIKSFSNLEPRISMAYIINDQTSVKASYNRLSQYLHLVSNTSSPTPLDVWAPSGKYIKPQLLDQFALGYFKTVNGDKYNIEIEGFYKTIKNRIDYIDGADLIANDAIEQVILNGKARAYGLELLLRTSQKNFKGWIAYTISKSEQQTKGRNESELGINNGKWYNTPYDKTHDVSFTGSYDLNKSWKINANFVFQTGQPTTIPNAQYEFNDITIPNFGDRNTYRLPSYHRLDISANFYPKKSFSKSWKSFWTFSIYNIYNHKNAASITFRENNLTGNNEALRLSYFGIIPSVTYNFKF